MNRLSSPLMLASLLLSTSAFADICTTFSRGLEFTQQHPNRYYAQDTVVNQCRGNPSTSNSECSNNVVCFDEYNYRPLMSCTTHSRGLIFDFQSQNTPFAQNRVVLNCQGNPSTSNSECSNNVVCNDANAVQTPFVCETYSRGLIFTKEAKVQGAASYQAMSACQSHPSTSNSECSNNISCRSVYPQYPNPNTPYPGNPYPGNNNPYDDDYYDDHYYGNADDYYQYNQNQALDPYRALQGHGHWVTIRGTRFFVPRHMTYGGADEWEPYQHGYWSWDYNDGWTWVSYDPWGWVTDHYGVWRLHQNYGWIWLPFDRMNYVPYTVSWFHDGDYIGWYPYYNGYTRGYTYGYSDGFIDGYWDGYRAGMNATYNRNYRGYTVVNRRDVTRTNVYDYVSTRGSRAMTRGERDAIVMNASRGGNVMAIPGGRRDDSRTFIEGRASSRAVEVRSEVIGTRRGEGEVRRVRSTVEAPSVYSRANDELRTARSATISTRGSRGSQPTPTAPSNPAPTRGEPTRPSEPSTRGNTTVSRPSEPAPAPVPSTPSRSEPTTRGNTTVTRPSEPAPAPVPSTPAPTRSEPVRTPPAPSAPTRTSEPSTTRSSSPSTSAPTRRSEPSTSSSSTRSSSPSTSAPSSNTRGSGSTRSGRG